MISKRTVKPKAMSEESKMRTTDKKHFFLSFSLLADDKGTTIHSA